MTPDVLVAPARTRRVVDADVGGRTGAGARPPGPVADVVQKRVAVDVRLPLAPQLPDRCPKCDAKALRLQGRELHCAGALGGCGEGLYLVALGVPPIPPPLVREA